MLPLTIAMLLCVVSKPPYPAHTDARQSERESQWAERFFDPAAQRADKCVTFTPHGNKCQMQTQCIALSTYCANWPQASCFYSGGTNCECL
jgi:hypothetical protein